jgi:hypothetical protein
MEEPHDANMPCLTQDDYEADTTPTPIPYERMHRVLRRNLDRFQALPNYERSGVGVVFDYAASSGPTPTVFGEGISIGLSPGTNSVPKPYCLEGVPVFTQIWPTSTSP